MKKREKAVAIAKDVLKQLKLEKYVAITGRYIEPEFKDTYEDDEETVFIRGTSLQKIFKSRKITQCQVCALGSAYVSYIRVFNKEICDGAVPDGEQLTNPLVKIFSPVELLAMEAAFEGRCTGVSQDQFGNDTDEHEFAYISQAAGLFSDEVPDADERLTLIMKNIKKNKGKFIISGLISKEDRAEVEERIKEWCGCSECIEYRVTTQKEDEAVAC